MCANGINIGQFNLMLEQIDDHLKLERRWSHNLAHNAEDAGYEKTSELLHKVQALLDDARACLDEAADVLEDEAAAVADVQVTLV